MTDFPYQSHTAFAVFAFYPFYHKPQFQQEIFCYIKLYLYKWGYQHDFLASSCLCLKLMISLCQKFQDSKIEINGKKTSLSLIPTRQLHFDPLQRCVCGVFLFVFFLLGFNQKKDVGGRIDNQTSCREVGGFSHFSPSDLKSSLSTLFEFIFVATLFGPDSHTM